MKFKWKDITFVHKFWLLCALCFIMGVMSWQLAVKETLILRSSYNEILLGETQRITFPKMIARYKAEITQLEGVFMPDTQATSVRNHILNYTENFCDTTSLELIYFNPVKQEDEDGYMLAYNTVCLKGDYHTLLRYYHHFEQSERTNKLVSLKFYLKKEKFKQNRFLYSEGLIQSLIPHE